MDLKFELFAYEIDHNAQALAEAMDGKLLLVTNVADMDAEQIDTRYKSLADIERGFHVLESEVEIAAVFHRPLCGSRCVLTQGIRAYLRSVLTVQARYADLP